MVPVRGLSATRIHAARSPNFNLTHMNRGRNAYQADQLSLADAMLGD
jgi:hypothetical protein